MSEKISLKNLGLEGMAKWVHRFVMFVTYPFRHFYAFLIMLLIIIAICVTVPLLKGVSLKEIPTWYAQKIQIVQPLKNLQIKSISKKIKAAKFKKEVKLKRAEYEPKVASAEKNVELNEEKPEKYRTWNIKNKPVSQKGEIKAAVLEGQPQEEMIVEIEKIDLQAPKKVEVETKTIIESEERPDLPEPVMEIKEESVLEEIVPELIYQKRDDLGLTYYQTPKRITGEAIIYGANELYVDDTYLYLYGIYTDPNIHNEARARAYLRRLIANKTVECYIVAETKDEIGTGICFVAGKNINQSMVDAYEADNIAL